MRGERLFRQEALDEHARTFDREGAVLRIAPAWTSAAYWLVTAAAGAGLAFIAVASVPRYAEGPAIVRVEGLEDITAPIAATVAAVDVPPGQTSVPGDEHLAITGKGARPVLMAFLPGHHRPALRPGMTLRLELDGWPRTYQEVSIETVSERVIGPAEVRRLLGDAHGDSLALTGPVVLLRAGLPAQGFRAGERTLGYDDGLVGRAEVRLESERLLFLLVPALRGAPGS